MWRFLAVLALTATLAGCSRAAVPTPVATPGAQVPRGAFPSFYPDQALLDDYANQVAALVSLHGPGQSVEGFCSIAVDPPGYGLTLSWHGTPPDRVQAVLRRAHRAGVAVRVDQASYDKRTFAAAEGDLMQPDSSTLGVTVVSVATDCSALEVGLYHDTVASRHLVMARIHRPVPVAFHQQRPSK